MNTQQFNEIVDFRVQQIKVVLQQKALEYASAEDDRLHNFNTAGRLANTSREKALWGMAMKHLVSVIDLINNWDEKEQLPSEYMINEKIGDLINYLILLECCFKDRLIPVDIVIKHDYLKEEVEKPAPIDRRGEGGIK